jgi:Protein of unknown function (DUF1045)
MAGTKRYAVYFAPHGDTELWRFGSSIVGRDAETGRDCAAPQGLSRAFPDWRALTAAPRLYGFHATLKAPLRLANGTDEQDLLAAVAQVVRRIRPFELGHLQIRALQNFVALVPTSAPAQLADLESRLVQALDAYRGHVGKLDRGWRKPEALTARQRQHLEDWGYPFVLDEYHFHMPLTGPLKVDQLKQAERLLSKLHAPISGSIEVDSVAVFRQSSPVEPFKVIARQTLGR